MYDFPVISESFLSSLNDEAKSILYDLQAKLAQKKESPSVVSSKILPVLSQILPDWLTESEHDELGDYITNVVIPYLFISEHFDQFPKPALPILDKEELNKQDALPDHYWGLLYHDWALKPEDGTSVFITGYDQRGEYNKQKRIYYSAVTPNLYTEKYHSKVSSYFEELLSSSNASTTDSPKPLMRIYLDTYFGLYWDLHLGIADPEQDYKDIGTSFNAVLAYGNPLNKTFFDNYMRVRELREGLGKWVEDHLGSAAQDPTTFVYYWSKNKAQEFEDKDIVFECFHNFVAFSQWGHTIYKIIELLSENEHVKGLFQLTMQNPDGLGYESFTNLDLFVMELFRYTYPNDGSISKQLDEKYGYTKTSHVDEEGSTIHWTDPTQFNPDRYAEKEPPLSNSVDEQMCTQVGLAQCPFHKTDFSVSSKDDGTINLTNSGFGTVYSETDPVIDYAGYAPFGYGYRRCPGEQFTVEVIKDFLKIVHSRGINFEKLEIEEPEQVPLAPGALLDDVFGFTITQSTREAAF